MTQAKIVKAPASSRGYFVTTTKNTVVSQRDTLEEVITNLSSALGIQITHKQLGARGSYFYEAQDGTNTGFQSASNTILELSRKLANNKL